MANYRRSRLDGGTFFFTVVTHKRQAILTTPLGRECLRTAWEKVREKRPFEVVALCLLPDHLHCIWQMPGDDSDYSMRWSLIKRYFTRQYLTQGAAAESQSASREGKRYRGIWQRKFWEHRIKNDRDMENHINYTHYNPVKHGYVADPFAWEFSTVHKDYGTGHCDDQEWAAAKEMVLPGHME